MNPLVLAYGSLALAIISEVFGSASMQRSEQFSKLGPSIMAIAGFIAALFFLSQALRVLPLGVAYAIWAGLGVVLTAVVGVVFFKQSLDAPAIIGMGLIIAGVVVMNTLSRTSGH